MGTFLLPLDVVVRRVEPTIKRYAMKKWLMLGLLALGVALPSVALASTSGGDGAAVCCPCCCPGS